MTKGCKICGAEFEIVYPAAKYCSAECATVAKSRRVSKYYSGWYEQNKDKVQGRRKQLRDVEREVGLYRQRLLKERGLT